jgi:hypothetical protein
VQVYSTALFKACIIVKLGLQTSDCKKLKQEEGERKTDNVIFYPN